VFVLPAGLIACGDGGGGGSGDQGVRPNEQATDVACELGTKTLELIGARLHEGSSVRTLVEDTAPGLAIGCKTAVKIFVEHPQMPVSLTLRDPAGNPLTTTLTGSVLAQLTPATPATGANDCSYYTLEALHTMCEQGRISPPGGQTAP
jgi:hypothetical protein